MAKKQHLIDPYDVPATIERLAPERYGLNVKIGIMLRHINQHGGGVLVYTQNLLRELLALDSPHEFVLIYRDPAAVEAHPYLDSGRVRKVVVSAPSALLWDQVSVPQVAKKEKIDLIFNPKYSIPLATRSRTVFVCHGLDWYVMPEWSRWSDRMSHRYLVPRYARRADCIIAVSDTAGEHLVQFLGVQKDRVKTVYMGVDDRFRRSIPTDKLDEVRRCYSLPERFFLYCGQIYPPKNFGRLLKAYARVGPGLGLPLVVAGEHTWLCHDELELIEALGISARVVRPGWVNRDDLPAFYRLAVALVLPSLYEAFGLPLVEAMASGCPVLTTNRYGAKEIVGDAGILVDPEDVDCIASGMQRIATDAKLREQLAARGLERARRFSWKKCAQETLDVLESIG